MDNRYQLLTEKEEIWAEMLMEVLRDNDVPCTCVPVHGAGFVMKTGVPERLRIYVPAECMQLAEDLMEELFSAGEAQD